MKENKENVYGQISEAERSAQAQTGAEGNVAREKESSTALGKFKDVDALIKAYDCLQAEFTRRSQRLKELEKQAENLQRENGSAAWAEKLRKNAEARRAEEEKFDTFVAERESVQGRETNEEVSFLQTRENADGDLKTECQTADGKEREQEEGATGDTPVADKAAGEENGAGSEFAPAVETGRGSVGNSESELLQRVRENEGVRLKIIGEYLSSIGRSQAPLLLGGAGAPLAPPMKPRSINEAGSMALKMFEKSRKA